MASLEALSAVLDSIAKNGAARAVSIAQLLFPLRSKNACNLLVSRKWQPILANALAGARGKAATAIASTADLDRVLAVCGDAGAYDCLIHFGLKRIRVEEVLKFKRFHSGAVVAFEEQYGSQIRAAFGAGIQSGERGILCITLRQALQSLSVDGLGCVNTQMEVAFLACAGRGDLAGGDGMEQVALSAIAQHGVASASVIAQLLFPKRSRAACEKLVSRTWQPALERRRTSAGPGRPSAVIQSSADLDCVLATTNDAGAFSM